MTDDRAPNFSFGRFVLDLHRGRLLRDSAERPLRPKPTAFLRYLVEHPGRLVSREELAQAVWSGVIVSDASIDQCARAVRTALGDDARETLRTLPKRGYMLVPPVIATVAPVDATLPSDDDGPGHGGHKPAKAVLPSIAVLPFQNLSGNPENSYFVDGFVEEIITALSRIRSLFVVASASSFSYRPQAIEGAQAGRDLGVRYVLEGSVRRAGETLRITARLIDAESATHLWVERFDGSMRDLFELQDRVASQVAGVIEPTVQSAEAARAVNRPTENLDAYDLYLRGNALFLASAELIAPALQLLEDAIARDPRYGAALGLAAMCCQRLVADNRSHDPAQDRLKVLDYARRALEAAPNDCGVLVNAALALAYFGENIDAMLALVDRALALNPNFARGWHISGHLRLRAGLLDAAIEHTERSRRLSPRARVGNGGLVTIGAAHFYLRRFEAALPYLLQAAQEDPQNPNPYRYLAACYAYLGQTSEAAESIAQLQAVTDRPLPDVTYLRQEAHRSFFLAGLKLAMTPTPPRDATPHRRQPR